MTVSLVRIYVPAPNIVLFPETIPDQTKSAEENVPVLKVPLVNVIVTVLVASVRVFVVVVALFDNTETLEACVAMVAVFTSTVLFVAACILVRAVTVTTVLLVRVNVPAFNLVTLFANPPNVKSPSTIVPALNVPPVSVIWTEVVALPITVKVAEVTSAIATGSGPITPNKSDPTSASNVEVLVAPKEEDRVRLDIKDFLRNNFKSIFEALTFDLRARIKDTTRE